LVLSRRPLNLKFFRSPTSLLEMFLNGLDVNYVSLMEETGLKWRDEDKREIDDLFSFFRCKGANCLRVRIWVGDSGPSRLPYAMNLAENACRVDLKVQSTIFLSDSWADLYKQPEPESWTSLDLQDKLGLIESYIYEVVKKLMPIKDRCEYYQIGNEIDHGICGIFAYDKKKRKDSRWLKKHIWSYEAAVLKEAVRALRIHGNETPIALHLGKWWDIPLATSFLSAMDEFNVEYEIICFSFYPTMSGANFVPLRQFKETAEDRGKNVAIAEYAYPSNFVKGQFWYMNKPSPGYPLTLEGQSLWIRDFLAQCLKLNIYGAFYWSPELYLTKNHARRWSVPKEMPLGFGWGPMSFFDERGYAKPCVNSLKYGAQSDLWQKMCRDQVE